jgi:hypothetical protein
MKMNVYLGETLNYNEINTRKINFSHLTVSIFNWFIFRARKFCIPFWRNEKKITRKRYINVSDFRNRRHE